MILSCTAMPKIPHVKTVIRAGKKYLYFGRLDDSGKTIYDVRLPPLSASSFWETYAALKAGRTKRTNARHIMTIDKLAALYEASGTFKDLSRETQRVYSLTLRKIGRGNANGNIAVRFAKPGLETVEQNHIGSKTAVHFPVTDQ